MNPQLKSLTTALDLTYKAMEKPKEFNGQMLHEYYTFAVNAGKDASQEMAEGNMKWAAHWSKSAAHWWGRVAEELEKLNREGV